ncbi:exonuclease 3'-5' domain-containing protein 2-like [Haliotis cracherodii]|uniref:exonuclease 3'-5' domain-containing protein 2-like n=1 Tax=Haliotis cracherodii TaxID=6455 RepID=UPI0039EBC855
MYQTKVSLGLLIVPTLIVVGLGFGGYLLWTKSHVTSDSSRVKKKVKIRKKGEGITHVITTAAQWEKVFPQLVKDTQQIRVVGLDCEWVFEEFVRHPVALLQISTQQGLCLLVRLCQLEHRVPHSLRHFLMDKHVLKVGVAVKDDGKKLYRDYGLPVNGCVDLRFIMSQVAHIYNCKTRGLQGLAESVLGVMLDKDNSIRCGNWEAETLSEQQIQYAAADAAVGVDIFMKLVLTKMLTRNPDELYPPGTESVGEAEFWQAALAMCQGYIDMPFCSQRSHNKEDGAKQPVNKVVDTDCRGARAYSPRQRPLDFRCQLQTLSGKLIQRCDIFKAEWYLEKNLGRKISDDPFIVQLKYELEMTNEDEVHDNLYEDNEDTVAMCVVCGRTHAFIKKYVIPTEYKRYFHRVLKSARRSQNILILCPDCYQVSSQHDAILRQQLAHKCNAPLDSGAGSKTVTDYELQKVKAAAKALKFNREKIPQARVQELESTVMDFFEVTSLEPEIIEQASEMDVKVVNSSYVSHGKKVVMYYRADNKLYEFEKMWRQHFLETMQPKHMPPFWTVDFRDKQLHHVHPEQSQRSSVTETSCSHRESN